MRDGDDGVGAIWADLVEDSPELAERIAARFGANLHHVLGTIREDGAPRLSGTEISIAEGRVTLGMMPDSRKLADVRRDPRVEVHSAPVADDLADGDAKLAGILAAIPEPDDGVPGSYFELRIRLASLVRVEGDELAFTVWRPDRGSGTIRRR